MDMKKEKPKTKDDALFILRQKAKPPVRDNTQLIRAAEDWIKTRGFDPYKSEQSTHFHLAFNLIDSGECELSFRVSE